MVDGFVMELSWESAGRHAGGRRFESCHGNEAVGGEMVEGVMTENQSSP